MILYRIMSIYELSYIFEKDKIKLMYEKGMLFYYNLENIINTIEIMEELVDRNYLYDKGFGFSGLITKCEIKKVFFDENNIEYIDDENGTFVVKFKNIEEMNFFLYKMFLTFKILDGFYGENYISLPAKYFLKYDLIEQFIVLSKIDNGMDIIGIIRNEYVRILTNYYYWKKYDFSDNEISEGRKKETLSHIRHVLDMMNKNYLVDE